MEIKVISQDSISYALSRLKYDLMTEVEKMVSVRGTATKMHRKNINSKRLYYALAIGGIVSLVAPVVYVLLVMKFGNIEEFEFSLPKILLTSAALFTIVSLAAFIGGRSAKK